MLKLVAAPALLLVLVPQGYDEEAARLEEKGAGASTAPALVAVGDDYVKLAAKYGKRRQEALDRASYWYAKAWPDLDVKDKAKLKARYDRLYAPLAPRPPRKFPVPNWVTHMGAAHAPIVVTSAKAHTGSCSAMIAPAGRQGTKLVAASGSVKVKKGDQVQFSVWFLSEGTDEVDVVDFSFWEADTPRQAPLKAKAKDDLPIWHKVEGSAEVPEGIDRVVVAIFVRSTRGTLYIDDISVKVNGVEMLRNGGWEEQ